MTRRLLCRDALRRPGFRVVFEDSGGEVFRMAQSRLTWPQIQQCEEFRGRWVALDDCTYDSKTAQPLEGLVVDSDEDLVELCNRVRENEGRRCAILYCSGPDGDLEVPSAKLASVRPSTFPPPRSYH